MRTPPDLEGLRRRRARFRIYESLAVAALMGLLMLVLWLYVRRQMP